MSRKLGEKVMNIDLSNTKTPVVQEIIMSNRIGAISILLAKKLGIENIEALKLFYESETCRKLHDKSTGLYLYGDLYIVDEFLIENGAKM